MHINNYFCKLLIVCLSKAKKHINIITMGSKKLTKHPKEAFISPRVSLSVDLELEDCLLGASKNFVMPIVDTGHESYLYAPDTYWE